MYITDEVNLIIHDLSYVRHECAIHKIPADKKKKIYSIQTVKRMVDTSHQPRYNGCQYCLSEYNTFDFTKLFR